MQLPREPRPLGLGGLGGGLVPDVSEEHVLERPPEPTSCRHHHHEDADEQRCDEHRREPESGADDDPADRQGGKYQEVEQTRPNKTNGLARHDREHSAIDDDRSCRQQRDVLTHQLEIVEAVSPDKAREGPGNCEPNEHNDDDDVNASSPWKPKPERRGRHEDRAGHDDRRKIRSALELERNRSRDEANRGCGKHPPTTGAEEDHGEEGSPNSQEAQRERFAKNRVGTHAVRNVTAGAIECLHAPATGFIGWR